MDAAKENDVGLRRLRLVGKPERIAHVIGHLLDFAHLIIMRQDHGVLVLLEGQDFLLEGTHVLILTHPDGPVYVQPVKAAPKILLCPEAGLS